MPSRTTRQRSSRTTLLRNVGFAIAVALGAVGIWLIVTGGNSTQRVEIGVLTGLWGLLLGAICGRRVVLPDPDATPARVPAPQPADAVTPEAGGDRAAADSAPLAVRDSAPVDRLADAEARRAFEAELQKLLRQEVGTAVNSAVETVVENALGREIGALRAEIAQLRQELVDKVGGQLRLERIETTRLIGSDLEAMRDEVRRLKMARDPAALDVDVEVTDTESAPAPAQRRVNGVAATTETTRIPRVLPEEPEPEPQQEVQPETQQEAQPETQPERPTPAARPAPQPSAAAPAADPFASLPRLTPFTDFPLDPVEPPAVTNRGSDAGTADDPANSTAAGPRPGRRHYRDDEESGTSDAEHASGEATGRRHHRADDGGDDLLARLLAREGVRR